MPTEEKENILVTRDEMRSYMSCKADGKYHLIGEGFTDFSESKGAKEYSRKYVHNKTESTDVVSYSPSYSYSCDVISGDPVVGEIVEITDREELGSKARRDVVTANMWQPGTEPDTFKAYKRTYAIVPDSKASGTEALVCSGTMKAYGDYTPGVFNTKTETFTADDETAAASQSEPEA